MDTLTQPDNKATLTKILTYHVVPGTYDAKKLMKEIKKNNGSYQLNTVQGEPLTFSLDGKMIKITDAKGGTAMITTANVYQSNGVVHIIDTVLMPNQQRVSKFVRRLRSVEAAVLFPTFSPKS